MYAPGWVKLRRDAVLTMLDVRIGERNPVAGGDLSTEMTCVTLAESAFAQRLDP